MISPPSLGRRPRHEQPRQPRSRPRVPSRPRLPAAQRTTPPRGTPPPWFLRLVERKRAKRTLPFLAGVLLSSAIGPLGGAPFAPGGVGSTRALRNAGPV